MASKLRAHLTYANVVSTVCLFVVLGGTSYAVATGSIDSREIKNNTVRSKDIRNNSVRGRDLLDNSIAGIDILDGSLSGADIASGSIDGSPIEAKVRLGNPATAGANGAAANCTDGTPAGSNGYYNGSTILQSCAAAAGGSSTSIASCEADEVATGGGYTFAQGKRHALVVESRPEPLSAGATPTGWRIRVETLTFDSSNNTPVTPYAVCVKR